MIPPKSAHPNYRNIDRDRQFFARNYFARKFSAQISAPERKNNALLSQFQPQLGKRKTCNRVGTSALGRPAGQSPAQAAEKSGFVSGHRFSDAENSSKSDAPLGAAH
jgi:hypothetical protein